jgi:hypothetical protein
MNNIYEHFVMEKIYSYFLKTILILMIFIYIFSFSNFFKTSFLKNEINSNQINQIKYVNELYEDKIKKLKNQLY